MSMLLFGSRSFLLAAVAFAAIDRIMLPATVDRIARE
jgi:hypothetical protein